ncbi:hypothetical protein CN270_12285 [Priestia megaterium]|nr:hypothetical protein CN270_12285 [Priestia megaterium]
MPYVYRRTPFATSEPVFVIGDECDDTHPGARDIGFYELVWDMQVFAVEGGTVVELVRVPDCFSQKISDTEAIPVDCLTANYIAVRGNDGFYTEYAHVLSRNDLRVGSQVQAGELLGTVDNSGYTSGPHVHFARFAPNPNNPNVVNRENWVCDWEMIGLVPSSTRGWIQYNNGNWYYFGNNGRPLRGGWQLGDDGINLYQLDDITGAWTGWAYSPPNRRCYFRGVAGPCPQ